ncbi:HypC/HybG/HupF family hydrogenase formation chaperone [Corynebacterium hindlerae]|uniref:HypC/HybG/HupF family hydrogenase formation chaperone n=1 Tax=Corynebacterium hindlerae TaxID=699041 RepID=A0A7G5FH66_9CORY|nr:HypC/HybG/HupF family hydrogenase formation chaperone [Corynebacterium hindlerae]QMV85957.1 HypC/HybG/HupF family hydrogenase formation chaperone [Corynebacterium hindlerae]QTH60392.1 HypC/HybG/HupF family hydrogenase formation chaperone [Corynebacterium hindlerae]
MCLGIPAKITHLELGLMPTATIDVAGQIRQCCTAYVPEAQVGDYVLIQNGFAMSVLSEEDALASLEAIQEHHLLPATTPDNDGSNHQH